MFSIIIINYRTPKLTADCLNSLFKFCSQKDFEVIVVDNNSEDNSLVSLKEEFGARFKLIANSTNAGFAAANNLGAKEASGEYLFFLNSDTFIQSDILTPLKNALQKDLSIGVIAPGLVLKNGEPQPYAYGYNKKLKTELAWVSGAALVIRHEVFQKVNGWDERFFMYFEDRDLCQAVIRNGYKISRLSSISLTHLVNSSPIFFGRRKLYYYQAKIRFLLKYLF